MPQKNIVRGQNVSAEKVAKAKELRRNMTNAEKILWQELRTNKLGCGGNKLFMAILLIFTAIKNR